MPANEPIQNLPAPINSDPPDGPTQIAAVNTSLVTKLNMRFANTGARDAALPTPVDGMECFTGSGSSAVKWIYINGEWVMQAIRRIEKVAIPIQSGEGWGAEGTLSATRTANGIVTVNANKPWGTAGYGAVLGNLPGHYAPSENVYASAVTGSNFGSGSTGASIRVTPAGVIQAYGQDRTSYFRASIAFPAASAT